LLTIFYGKEKSYVFLNQRVCLFFKTGKLINLTNFCHP
jgi:hypothetical protein